MKNLNASFLVPLLFSFTVGSMDLEVFQERVITNLQRFKDNCSINEKSFFYEHRKYGITGCYAGNKFYEDFVHSDIGVIFTGMYSRCHENKMWNPTIRSFVRIDKEHNRSDLSSLVDGCIQMQRMFDQVADSQQVIARAMQKRKFRSEYTRSVYRTEEALLYDDLDEIKNCMDRAKSYSQDGLLLSLRELFAYRSLSIPGSQTKCENFRKLFRDIPDDINKISFQLFLEGGKSDELS